MQLYHVDRSGHIKEAQVIELVKNFSTNVTKTSYYKNGLSSHGLHYFLNDVSSKDYAIDVIFEYERMLKYPNKLSRYQAFYAFDKKGVLEFIKNKNLEDNYFKIYKINVDKYERHNMQLVRGWSHSSIINYAKLYWEDGEDPIKDRTPLYEYLIELPVTIGNEIDINDLKQDLKDD